VGVGDIVANAIAPVSVGAPVSVTVPNPTAATRGASLAADGIVTFCATVPWPSLMVTV
jgi:hypothetical protein